jgi:DNA-binding Lrp family transcriptional regulator
LRVKNVSEEEYQSFAKSLFHNYPTFWVAFMSGSFDIIVDMFAKNGNHFDEMMKQIVQKHNNIIQSYETLVLLELTIYEYGYFIKSEDKVRGKVVLFNNKTTSMIDKKDALILSAMKHNARLPYEKIGEQAGLTRNAVKSRVQRLLKEKIIAGYKAMVDFRHFGFVSPKVFIKYNTSMIQQEKELLAYLENTPGVLANAKLLGRWNLDIEIHIPSGHDLQKFIINLRNRFPLIEDYEIVEITEDYGIDFFPDKVIDLLFSEKKQKTSRYLT